MNLFIRNFSYPSRVKIKVYLIIHLSFFSSGFEQVSHNRTQWTNIQQEILSNISNFVMFSFLSLFGWNLGGWGYTSRLQGGNASLKLDLRLYLEYNYLYVEISPKFKSRFLSNKTKKILFCTVGWAKSFLTCCYFRYIDEGSPQKSSHSIQFCCCRRLETGADTSSESFKTASSACR